MDFILKIMVDSNDGMNNFKANNREKKMFYDAIPDTFITARYLRQNRTKSEKILWERLRNKRMLGYRFKCQHPIGYYVADFYCHAVKLVIEVDGNHHLGREQNFNDNERTRNIEILGITVVRFSNHEVEHNIETVIDKIKCFLVNKAK
jgi:very-short-patch-repair endonuclease